jgi:hypothetical protein
MSQGDVLSPAKSVLSDVLETSFESWRIGEKTNRQLTCGSSEVSQVGENTYFYVSLSSVPSFYRSVHVADKSPLETNRLWSVSVGIEYHLETTDLEITDLKITDGVLNFYFKPRIL